MPPRDEQDFENRRQQIIDGALHVFASKGFERATNKDIAESAGIGSPGLIYHYFKDKADLLRQVIEQRAPVVQLLNRSESMMALPPREALTLFGRSFLQVMDNQAAVALMKLMLGEAVRQSSIAKMINSIGPARGFAFLTRYLSAQMDASVLRRMDPGAAARCFLGPLVIFLLAREVFPQQDSGALDADTMLAAAVDVFLQGMELPSAR